MGAEGEGLTGKQRIYVLLGARIAVKVDLAAGSMR